MSRSSRIGLVALSMVASHVASFAQPLPCYAENDGANFNDLVSMGGPNLLLGIRFVAPVAISVTSIEVFTGEVPGANTVGIWSDDAALNQPLTDLSTGSFTAVAANSWQGASLPTPVSLAAGATYWMVWGPQNAAQASIELPMTIPGQVYRGSFNNGASWNGPWQFTSDHWKFRLICCQGFVMAYGSACLGGSGIPPGMGGAGCATPGSQITIDMLGAPPNAFATIFLGAGTGAALVTPACSMQNLPLFAPTIPFTFGPSGTLTFPAVIPLSTPVPADLYLQTLIADPTAPFGIASTNPLRIHIE